MSLKLLDSLSLPGDPARANEDAFAVLPSAAMVFDGATPLGPPLLPGTSDAAWIAQFGARRLAAHLSDGDDPQAALTHALADAQKSFAGLSRRPIQEKWQTPCAAMMLVSQAPDGDATFLWYGDCAAIVAIGEGIEVVGEVFDRRGAEADRARRLVKEKNLSPAPDLNRPAVLDALKAARNRINSGDNWLFSPEPRAARHAARRVTRLSPGAALLIASDGFLALATDYGAYSAAGLIAAAQEKGLAALGEELRLIEARDSQGEKYARFKKSDDATALLLRLT